MNRSITVAALTLLSGAACAQSLFLRPPPEVEADAPEATPAIVGVSMFYVQPPQPRLFQRHDIVHVIVNENSSATSTQTLETVKELQIDNQLQGVLDPIQLLELRLQAATLQNLQLLQAETTNEFIGEGQYDRQDDLRARIAAEVVDVKPNGTMLLRARKVIGTDEERRTMTLTGTVRNTDVTDEGTVLSSQIADLVIEVTNDGEVRKGAKKGVITKALEAIFNF